MCVFRGSGGKSYWIGGGGPISDPGPNDIRAPSLPSDYDEQREHDKIREIILRTGAAHQAREEAAAGRTAEQRQQQRPVAAGRTAKRRRRQRATRKARPATPRSQPVGCYRALTVYTESPSPERKVLSTSPARPAAANSSAYQHARSSTPYQQPEGVAAGSAAERQSPEGVAAGRTVEQLAEIEERRQRLLEQQQELLRQQQELLRQLRPMPPVLGAPRPFLRGGGARPKATASKSRAPCTLR